MILVLICAYTSNLFILRSIHRSAPIPSNLEQLLEDKEMKFGTMDRSSTNEFFKVIFIFKNKIY